MQPHFNQPHFNRPHFSRPRFSRPHFNRTPNRQPPSRQLHGRQLHGRQPPVNVPLANAPLANAPPAKQPPANALPANQRSVNAPPAKQPPANALPANQRSVNAPNQQSWHVKKNPQLVAGSRRHYKWRIPQEVYDEIYDETYNENQNMAGDVQPRDINANGLPQEFVVKILQGTPESTNFVPHENTIVPPHSEIPYNIPGFDLQLPASQLMDYQVFTEKDLLGKYTPFQIVVWLPTNSVNSGPQGDSNSGDSDLSPLNIKWHAISSYSVPTSEIAGSDPLTVKLAHIRICLIPANSLICILQFYTLEVAPSIYFMTHMAWSGIEDYFVAMMENVQSSGYDEKDLLYVRRTLLGWVTERPEVPLNKEIETLLQCSYVISTTKSLQNSKLEDVYAMCDHLKICLDRCVSTYITTEGAEYQKSEALFPILVKQFFMMVSEYYNWSFFLEFHGNNDPSVRASLMAHVGCVIKKMNNIAKVFAARIKQEYVVDGEADGPREGLDILDRTKLCIAMYKGKDILYGRLSNLFQSRSLEMVCVGECGGTINMDTGYTILTCYHLICNGCIHHLIASMQ